MGLGKFLKKIAPIALPILGSIAAPGIGTALGSTLGAATLSGIGGAVGGGFGGAIGGGGISGALKGAALGGAGGYLSGGGLDELLSGTSLSSGLNSLSNGVGLGDVISPAADTARAATSAAATAGGTSGGFLSGYLPGGGAAGAGGGTSGGFFSNLLGSGGDVASNGLEVGKAYDFTNTPWLSDVFSGGAAANPLTDYSAITGAGSVASKAASGAGKNLIGGALKMALPFAFQQDNAGGYGTLQSASANSAANYQPYLDAGAGATRSISDLLGANGADAAQAATANFENTPGYQFVRDQGIKSLDASAASRGMLRSGNQEQAVQSFGSGLAQQMYQQYLDNLAKQQQTGLAGAQGVGQGNIDAATAYAAMKGGKATNYNNILSGLAAFL